MRRRRKALSIKNLPNGTQILFQRLCVLIHLLLTVIPWSRYCLYIIFTFESLFFSTYVLCLQIFSIQPPKYLFHPFSVSPVAIPYLRPPSNLTWEGSSVTKLIPYVTTIVGAAFGLGSWSKGTSSVESMILRLTKIPLRFLTNPLRLPSVSPNPGLNLWPVLINQ